MNSETPNTPHASPKSECPACPETERIQARKVFVPAVDIIETKEALLLVSEMPGVDDSGIAQKRVRRTLLATLRSKACKKSRSG